MLAISTLALLTKSSLTKNAKVQKNHILERALVGLHTKAMETGLLPPDDKDLAPGCWRHWCRSREEYVLQRNVWCSIFAVCLFVWAIAVTVIAVMTMNQVNELEERFRLQTVYTKNTLNGLAICTHCNIQE